MERKNWADREQLLQLGGATRERARFYGASRMGSIELQCPEMSIWLQMRGASWLESKEGRFRLLAGDWMILAKDSMPVLQAGQQGICIGLTVGEDAVKAMAHFSDFGLHVGRGRMSTEEAGAFARLWRRAARRAGECDGPLRVDPTLRSMFMRLESLQRDQRAALLLCPGSALARKRQVFERMQRAHLYLEGNCHRIVRITELAERAQFSSWYFSKVFVKLYRRTPQEAASSFRLEHAASLLTSTPMTISEVGIASGFDNNCSFARSFRARFGMTASEYRNSPQPFEHTTQTCGTSRARHVAIDRTQHQHNAA
ncbi:helix-turn-helix transcriptional regulator [Lysobacter arenosi]|uniref:Helix-turn-helix transcriptional regulator n=1 Tax=Lysobacter arenosi TaxID=2795387 RepID=A0ABX7RAC2_9GAMM|nr:helix-turn-helix transcriptional regulator [Lysobacter arenosi]QSX73934.1 helix-turn-helix transcriptional regulator [Lysobacter arenosi]